MMASLKNIHVSDEIDLGTNDARDNTITLLGQIYRRCPDSDRPILLWGLADLFSCPSSEQLHHNSQEMSSLEPPSAARSLSQTQRQTNTNRAGELHCYTSRLYERAQKEGKSFRRTGEKIISYDPPLFKITVKYGDMVCSGQARTKKEAAHLAARGICTRLNGNLSL